ncbi:Ku protein (plasmid) [Tistrella bauzanensis]|uniref:non-homologous end joining protein Ku n=1 Tax=Tistrella TaxID=171436 RepID=UPI0031F6158C
MARARKPATGTGATGTDAPASRPVWTGHMRLALVSVPVKLYAATSSGPRISFHQVHEPSQKRIRYQKIVPGIGPVDTDEIVKGFELEKGRYVLVDPRDIDALKIETRHTLDLVQFVDHGEIAPIWYDRPYYVVPDGDLAMEAYGVLRDALTRAGRVGLGQFVMRGREYVAALKPCGRGMILETLRFSDEVRRAAPFFTEIDDDAGDPELLDMASELIDRKTAPFDPKRFEDHYTAAVRELIEAKSHDKQVEIDEGTDEATGGGAKVIDLVEALRRSVKGAGKKSGGGKGGGSGRRKAG